ncbi:MAG TPA: tetratricopeptide repeat protein [Thermoanaerobaculia bacterium]|nr:tetratricopeptide repeat protein [Thermoanaerobaculia bacterium]
MVRIITAWSLLIVAGVSLGACSGYGKPEHPSSQLAFGVSMARRGLWSEAQFRFEQARHQDPANPRILNNLAVANEALGRFEDAQRYYQEALKSAPGDPDIKRNYARFIEFYQSYTTGKSPEGEKPSEKKPGEKSRGGTGQPQG